MRKSIVVAAAAPLVSPRTAEVQLDAAVCAALLETLELRKTYAAARRGEAGGAPEVAVGMPSEAAVAALNRVVEVSQDPDVQAFCRTRCLMLEKRYDMYDLEHQYREHEDQAKCNTDFHSVAKADTHIHASAMMTAVQLDQFMRRIYERDRDRPLDDKGKTVGSTMRGAGFQTKGEHNAESLNVQASYRMFGNFKNFNAAFTPSAAASSSRCSWATRPSRASTSRPWSGSARASRTRAGAFLEPRFSIYGRKPSEWKTFATWVRRWQVDEMPGVLIAIQLPRVYPVWRRMGAVTSFGAMLRNFWGPLFEAALSDEDDDVKWLLDKIRVIDTVDDESIEDHPDLAGSAARATGRRRRIRPRYAYYMHENVARLNALLRARKLRSSPLTFKPHAGEAGPADHLATAFLFSDGVSHGINLETQQEAVALQYLYYAAQVPIGVSPISNSVLFLKYAQNPFPTLFAASALTHEISVDAGLSEPESGASQLSSSGASRALFAARGARPARDAYKPGPRRTYGDAGPAAPAEASVIDPFTREYRSAALARSDAEPSAFAVCDERAYRAPRCRCRYDGAADVLRLAGGRTTAIGSQLLPEPVALFLAVAAMEAVLAVHDADVLHLDVKPDNFLAMLGEDLDGSACVLRGAGDVADTAAANGFGLVLIDFGRAVDRRSHAPGTRFETAHDHAHLAEFEWPRAVKDGRRKRKGGDDSWTTELDVYALGVCLHLLCSNRARARRPPRRCPGPGTGPSGRPSSTPTSSSTGPSRRAARAALVARCRATPGARGLGVVGLEAVGVVGGDGVRRRRDGRERRRDAAIATSASRSSSKASSSSPNSPPGP
ncbi:adenosine-phosphate deaminase [Aureococcus anophagefferens]|nr:adenosine-phosphate deaminase [Aureococcus anophagefferens]